MRRRQRTSRTQRFVLACVWLAVVFTGGCGHSPDVPDSASTTNQKLPFDREPASSGASPTQSLVPAGTQLPEGATLTVRLRNPLSSATARVGESFAGALDEPVENDQQIVLPKGTAVAGRVLDVRAGVGEHNPGYLRVTLVSLNVGGKTLFIETSSIFAKARAESERPPIGSSSGSNQARNGPLASEDILFTIDRRLTFRLAQAVDLP